MTNSSSSDRHIRIAYAAGHADGRMSAAMTIHNELVTAGNFAASSLVLRAWERFRNEAEAASKERDEAMFAQAGGRD